MKNVPKKKIATNTYVCIWNFKNGMCTANVHFIVDLRPPEKNCAHASAHSIPDSEILTVGKNFQSTLVKIFEF